MAFFSVPTSPSPIAAGIPATLQIGLEQPGANFVRLWCVGGPDGSSLSNALLKSGSTAPRVEVYAGAGGAAAPWHITFDKGGVYSFKAQEYTKGTGFSGGYQGDPRGAQTETPLSTEYSPQVAIGQRFTQTLGVAPDTATLVFWSFGDVILPTTLGIYGEVSPAIINPRTPAAKSAAQTAATAAAISALVPASPLTVGSAMGSISGMVSDFVLRFNAHIASAVFHANADTDNALKTDLVSAPTPQSLITFATIALRALRQHETNDKGSGVGSATAAYHSPSGARSDMLNQPVLKGVGGVESAYAALADLWRAYEAHRVSAVHTAVDNTNALSAISKIPDVHRNFLAALANPTPTAAPGDLAGAALLKNWGFTATN